MNYLVCILLLLILVLIILILLVDFDYKKKLGKCTNHFDEVYNFILKDMINIMSLDVKASDKIVALNNTFISKLKIKYSSICIYDGYNFEVKASNVEKEYVNSIKEVAYDKVFKNNVSKDNSKYIVAERGKNLLYKSAIERGITSALFIPIYFESNFLGFILFEETSENNLEKIANDDLIELKSNIANFIENIEFQHTFETANIIDSQTDFYNNVYLYANVRKLLMPYKNSAMIVVRLDNLPEINEKYGRNIGNLLLVKLANATKEILGEDNIYVRFSGLRFIIFVKNQTAETIQPNIERLLSKYKKIYEYESDKKVKVDTKILIHTLRKQNNLEKEIQKTMSQMDWMKNVNTIKIV